MTSFDRCSSVSGTNFLCASINLSGQKIEFRDLPKIAHQMTTNVSTKEEEEDKMRVGLGLRDRYVRGGVCSAWLRASALVTAAVYVEEEAPTGGSPLPWFHTVVATVGRRFPRMPRSA